MGWDHDRRATIDVLSNSFQQELQGKKRIIIIRGKDDKRIFSKPSICQKILGDSIFGKMKIWGNGLSIKFEINMVINSI